LKLSPLFYRLESRIASGGIHLEAVIACRGTQTG
jgi:hypothetical protein